MPVTYAVLPSNKNITLWSWTDPDNVPYFEFKINDSSEYWIPSTSISTEYGGEFNGLISKIENGIANPTLAVLKRLAEGMDMVLKLEFVPKNAK